MSVTSFIRRILVSPAGFPVSRRLYYSSCGITAPKSRAQQSIVSSLDDAGVSNVNSRLETLRLTAAFNSQRWLLQPSQPAAVDLPPLASWNQPVVDSPLPSDKVYINPTGRSRIAEINDPEKPGSPAKIEVPAAGGKETKWAHRMLRIRKKKMKLHRRKRLWKRMWTVWKKKFFGREKQRELAFRQRLIDAVKVAKKFDAQTYVDLYLEDARFEFTPKTYKGRSKPRFVIEELLDRDKRVEERKRLDRTDLVTGKPLLLDAETVQQFIERNWEK